MRTNHFDVHSSIPALALCGVLLFAQPLLAADEVETTVFGTDVVPTQWLITGAGVTDAPARSTPNHAGFISFTSDGTRDGLFIPGASAGAFNGAWYADYSFAIPRRAHDITFDFFDLGVDDRAVLLLNGSALGNATIFGATGAGQHTFAPGEAASPFTFTQTTEGEVSGDDNSLFIVGDKDPRGKENVLRLSVNNTGNTYPGSTAIPLGGGTDGTVARVRGSVSWTADYQIRPYPNPQGNAVEVDDDPHGWYNAVAFDNDGAIQIVVGGWLTNRAGATIFSKGLIDNKGRFDVADSSTLNILGGSFQNNGSLTVDGNVLDSVGIRNGAASTLTINGGGTLSYSPVDGGGRFVSEGVVLNRGKFETAGEGAEVFLDVLQNYGTFAVGAGAYASALTVSNDHQIFVEGEGATLDYGKLLVNHQGGLIDVRSGGRLDERMDVSEGYGFEASNFGVLKISGGGFADISRLDNDGQVAVLDGGDMVVANDFVNGSLGEVYVVGLGGRLQTGRLENHGRIEVSGNLVLDMPFPGVLLADYNDGVITVDDGEADGISYGGSLFIGQGFMNEGSVTATGLGKIEVAGTGHVTGGYFGASPGAVFSALDGGTITVNGTFDENAVYCSGGLIKGRGTFGANAEITSVNGCSVRMGTSPGTLSILGNLNMDSTSEIEVEIGSPDDYDHLLLGGEGNFDSTQVRVQFVDGYLPDEPDIFAWLIGNNLSGSTTLSYGGLPSNWTIWSSPNDNGVEISMRASDAANLGSGNMPEDVVNGAGQVAFVDQPENPYYNIRLLDNSGAVHNRKGSWFQNYGGTLLNRAGAWLVNRGQFRNEFAGSVQNFGTFYNHATGVVENFGDFLNAAGGRLVNRGLITSASGSIFRNEGHVDNRGEIVVGEDVFEKSGIENSGLFEIAAGAVVRDNGSGSSSYKQLGGETRVNGVLNANEIIFYGGRLTGIGQVEGDVTMADAFLADGTTTGTIDPGDILGTGTLSVTGNVTMRILHIDLASAALYDVLAIDGAIIGTDLPATLEVSLLGGYRPGLGDGFDYLTALNTASFSSLGSFANMILPALDPGLAWSAYEFAGFGGTRPGYRIEVVASAVPAPGTLGLLGTGLGAVLIRLRRRRPSH
jgi:hypothetical protein